VRKEPFATEDQAVDKARALLASGEAFACVLEDDNGIVADDAEIAERCKLQYGQNASEGPAWRASCAGSERKASNEASLPMGLQQAHL
jgi:hypothetical protein